MPPDPTDTGSTAAGEGLAYACANVCRSSNGERLDVKGSFLEPGGVIGNKNELAKMDLAALSQSTAGNHDDGNRKNRNLTRKSLRHPPTVGANCRGSKSDSRIGGRYGEARS